MLLLVFFSGKNNYAETVFKTKAIILESESTVDCAPPRVRITDQRDSLALPAQHSSDENLVIKGKLTINCAETRENNQSWTIEEVGTTRIYSERLRLHLFLSMQSDV